MALTNFIHATLAGYVATALRLPIPYWERVPCALDRTRVRGRFSCPYRGEVTAPWSYLLCATPRTGSTLLCSLLSSTGVAGRPESYFREQDEHAWAARLGVPIAGDGSFDYLAFGRAAARAGRTPYGVFGARIMWGRRTH